jgi:hypothetical protein
MISLWGFLVLTSIPAAVGFLLAIPLSLMEYYRQSKQVDLKEAASLWKIAVVNFFHYAGCVAAQFFSQLIACRFEILGGWVGMLIITGICSIIMLSLGKFWLSSRIGVRLSARKTFAFVYTFLVIAPGLVAETCFISLMAFP